MKRSAALVSIGTVDGLKRGEVPMVIDPRAGSKCGVPQVVLDGGPNRFGGRVRRSGDHGREHCDKRKDVRIDAHGHRNLER